VFPGLANHRERFVTSSQVFGYSNGQVGWSIAADDYGNAVVTGNIPVAHVISRPRLTRYSFCEHI
jgi:hypothetical protein